MVDVSNERVLADFLMRMNVGDKSFKQSGNLLLIGSCMDKRFSEIVDEFRSKEEGYAALHVCLEETHVNQAGFKIASIVRYSGIKKILVLTVDGSPHCVQLHYVVEDIKRHFTSEIEIEHHVIEKGKVFEISSQAVKRSRHLSKIQKMIVNK